jgi:hypothetical protein
MNKDQEICALKLQIESMRTQPEALRGVIEVNEMEISQLKTTLLLLQEKINFAIDVLKSVDFKDEFYPQKHE